MEVTDWPALLVSEALNHEAGRSMDGSTSSMIPKKLKTTIERMNLVGHSFNTKGAMMTTKIEEGLTKTMNFDDGRTSAPMLNINTKKEPNSPRKNRARFTDLSELYGASSLFRYRRTGIAKTICQVPMRENEICLSRNLQEIANTAFVSPTMRAYVLPQRLGYFSCRCAIRLCFSPGCSMNLVRLLKLNWRIRTSCAAGVWGLGFGVWGLGFG